MVVLDVPCRPCRKWSCASLAYFTMRVFCMIRICVLSRPSLGLDLGDIKEQIGAYHIRNQLLSTLLNLVLNKRSPNNLNKHLHALHSPLDSVQIEICVHIRRPKQTPVRIGLKCHIQTPHFPSLPQHCYPKNVPEHNLSCPTPAQTSHQS